MWVHRWGEADSPPPPGGWASSSQSKACTERLRNGGARLPDRSAGTPVSRASAGQETSARRGPHARPWPSGKAHTAGGSVFRLATASGSHNVSGQLGGVLKGGAGWHVASSGLRYRKGGSRRPPRHVTGPSHSVARFPGPRLSRESGGFLRTFNRESRNTKRWHLRFSAGTRARVSARPSEPGTGPIPGAAPRIRPCPSLWCLLRRLTYTWVRGILTHPVPVLIGGAWRS